jgi:hypothetical protein
MIAWLAYNILVKIQKTPCSVYERPDVGFASFIQPRSWDTACGGDS